MRTFSFNKTLRLVIAAVAVVAAVPAMIFAQGETFTDCDAWAAAVGDVVGDDFESLRTLDDEAIPQNLFVGSIPAPQTLLWGELSTSISNFDHFTTGFVDGVDSGMFISDGRPLIFTPDSTVVGPLEGVCFNYRITVPVGIVSFDAFDGDTLVASIPLPNATDDSGATVASTFGWQNTEELNVTRFEFSLEGSNEFAAAAVGDVLLSFGEIDPPEVTCFEQLGDVEANLAALVDTLSGNDAYFAGGALDCVRWMQHDCFWEQPSGNRLSRYGGSLFIGAAYTIHYLEWVDDPQADVLIDDLIAVLECIVDNEIAYAIANGGSQSFIDRAEDFAALGEIIDDDFENEVVASLAYRLAWLHAYYSTQ